MRITPYDREKVVEYAHRWAYSRNPSFYDFELIGGDCTNFASQCIFAGNSVMNYTPDLGWYYVDANSRSASWTGVGYLHSFLLYGDGVGPFARETNIGEMEPGDLVQLKFEGGYFQHSPIVVSVGSPPDENNVLVAAHTYNCDYRALSTFGHSGARFLHILGVKNY